MIYYAYYPSDVYLAHHGIQGQQWGIRKYQNYDGSLTDAGIKRYRKASNIQKDLNKYERLSKISRNLMNKSNDKVKKHEEKASSLRQKLYESHDDEWKKKAKRLTKEDLSRSDLKLITKRNNELYKQLKEMYKSGKYKSITEDFVDAQKFLKEFAESNDFNVSYKTAMLPEQSLLRQTANAFILGTANPYLNKVNTYSEGKHYKVKKSK